jgi:hypothetical protein
MVQGSTFDSGSLSARDSACTDDDEDELARAMDAHVLVGQSPYSAHTQTADQVIDEIDQIMQVCHSINYIYYFTQLYSIQNRMVHI